MGSGFAARGVLPFLRLLTCRQIRNRTATAIAARVKKLGGAALVSPTISRITTMRAIPAVPIIMEERNAALRSL